ncbi:hypothetical protein E2562_020341 [Oryza meyeriana var. granulata]|uniref:Uncharacterized protein n=1 Tax=Oryza meyeriana var. granulata TaxID=110450 RepID=A0A6G1EB41_9ORYZ|nr:hypothetical protein E2562_020341 [Oryza meyeriana var. granulata]
MDDGPDLASAPVLRSCGPTHREEGGRKKGVEWKGFLDPTAIVFVTGQAHPHCPPSSLATIVGVRGVFRVVTSPVPEDKIVVSPTPGDKILDPKARLLIRRI